MLARKQPRVLEGPEVEEVNSPLKFPAHSLRQRQGDRGFANASGPDDRYETLFLSRAVEAPRTASSRPTISKGPRGRCRAAMGAFLAVASDTDQATAPVKQ